ncbi:WD40/YVTN/BNR-like repeat-containing protein [Flavobacterium zepuense]|nr:sialidase family protein [Flavobacterium zepuense]
MKKLYVFVPAFIPVFVLLLLNSFVTKEEETGKKTPRVTKYSASAPLCDSMRTAPFGPVEKVDQDKSGAVNIVYKSADGGKTWQDISTGLPETDQPVIFFAGETDLYLHAKNVMYRSDSKLKTPVWEKENIPGLQGESFWPSTTIAFNRSGITAFNYDGGIYQKTPATANWLPIHQNFKKHALRTTFEAADGALFLGYDHDLYKSADKGKSWKQVQNGQIMNIVESEGILIATGNSGIMRSADNGEHWQEVINEGGVGIAIERIKGGFAAISYNTKTETRRVRISVDSGKTWQAIDEGLPPSSFITSIKQMGNYLVCGHPDGIFLSSDMGKTWTKVHPGINAKVFSIYASGNALYAVAGSAGC